MEFREIEEFKGIKRGIKEVKKFKEFKGFKGIRVFGNLKGLGNLGNCRAQYGACIFAFRRKMLSLWADIFISGCDADIGYTYYKMVPPMAMALGGCCCRVGDWSARVGRRRSGHGRADIGLPHTEINVRALARFHTGRTSHFDGGGGMAGIAGHYFPVAVVRG